VGTAHPYPIELRIRAVNAYDIRKGVMWRKASFGTDSERGSSFAERILTV
jgi:hypothetical protein